MGPSTMSVANSVACKRSSYKTWWGRGAIFQSLFVWSCTSLVSFWQPQLSDHTYQTAEDRTTFFQEIFCFLFLSSPSEQWTWKIKHSKFIEIFYSSFLTCSARAVQQFFHWTHFPGLAIHHLRHFDPEDQCLCWSTCRKHKPNSKLSWPSSWKDPLEMEQQWKWLSWKECDRNEDNQNSWHIFK